MLKAHEITKDLTAERTKRALKRHIGRGKDYSVAEFAEMTGQDVRTVDAHCRGETAPHLFVWMRYAAVLPDAFANEYLEIVGLTVAQSEPVLASAAELLADTCGLSSMLARHMADGHQDHMERAEAEPALRQLRSMIDAYLMGGCCDVVRVPVRGVVK